MDTFIFVSIASVPIVETKAPVFPSAQVPVSLSSISTSRKPSNIAAVAVVETIAPVFIVTKIPIKKKKSLFQPVTTTFSPSAKVPASLSLISVPRKKSPATTDYIIPRVEIVGPEFRGFMFGGADIYKKLALK